MSPARKPHGPALPNALAIRRNALGREWAARVVFGTGTEPATAPAPEIEDGDKPRHIGKHKTARKTIDIERPVGSVSLRCRHTSGLVVVATWVYRIDEDKWSFVDALIDNCSNNLSAKAFAALTSHDFTEGTTCATTPAENTSPSDRPRPSPTSNEN